MEQVIIVVECIIEYLNKFLVIKRPSGVHAEGLLSFPGGKFEVSDGQTDYDVLKTAVKREILEEVGLVIKDSLHYVTSSYFIDSKNKRPIIDAIFHCKIEKTDPIVIPNSREVPEYFWMTSDDILTNDKAPDWVRKYLSLAMAESLLSD